MAVKTWTSERVTSADINTYLTNSGLVWIKEQTIGSGVASVTVSSVFSATYDNYYITINNASSNANGNLAIQFGSTTTGYYGSQYYDFYVATTNGLNRINNGASNRVGVLGTVTDTFITIQCSGPFTATRTLTNGTYFGGGYTGFHGGQLANTTSYTSFTLVPVDASSSITGGTITVYGYRKA